MMPWRFAKKLSTRTHAENDIWRRSSDFITWTNAEAVLIKSLRMKALAEGGFSPFVSVIV